MPIFQGWNAEQSESFEARSLKMTCGLALQSKIGCSFCMSKGFDPETASSDRLRRGEVALPVNPVANSRTRRAFFVIPVPYLFGIMTVVAMLLGWENYQFMFSRHYADSSFAVEAGNELIDCYVWSFIALVIWQLMRFFSLHGPKWKRDLAAHIAIAFAVAPLATLL